MSPEEFGRLVDEQATPLALYARQWCGAPEDIVQEAFLKLVVQKPLPEKPVAWLYRVVRNEALNASRSSRRRRQHEVQAGTRKSAWFLPTEGIGMDADAATQALELLPLEQRETIVAYLWGRLTFEEIGALTGTSSSTAHRWYLAGLATLRERLELPWPKKSPTKT
jgi:RNA polymerase sigma-70 factor (ECF subfamily)